MYACSLCVLKHGLKAEDVPKLPRSFSKLARHLREVHGVAADEETLIRIVPADIKEAS